MGVLDVIADLLNAGTTRDPRASSRLATGLSGRNPYQSTGTMIRPPTSSYVEGGPVGSGLNLPPRNQVQEILEELQRLQDPSRYGVDQALLERQAMAAASAQYDPITSALRGQASAAQQRAGRNRQQLGSMYEGLSQSLINDVAPIQQRFTETQNKTQEQYQGLQDQIKQQYATSQAEQEAMMRRLNIEAAAPQALEQQFKDRDFAVTQAAQEGQNVQSQLIQQGQGAVNYTQQGSQLARTEGTNRQADLMAQLSDYLTQVEGQIGANQAAKSAAVQGNLASLMQESQKGSVDRAQRDFENYIKVLGVMRQLEGGDQKSGPAKSPVDVGPRAMSLGLPMSSAQNVQNAFMTALSSDELIGVGVDPSSGMSLTKEALARQIVEVGRSRGLNTSELNALQNIALEYFGRQ